MPALTRMLGIASNSPLTTRDIPVLVIRAVVTMAAFFGSAPGLRAQAPASADQGASRQATVAKKAVAELDPFDLSYVPVEAKSIVACRPSAILRREDMKRHAETIQSLIVGLIDPEANLESQVKVGEIEQLTMGFMRSTGDEKKSGPSGLDTGVLAVRACHDVDWKKSIIGSGAASDWVVVGFSGRTYYKLKETRTQPPGEPAQDLCFYFPDRRTAVIAEGEGLLRGLMRPPAGSQPVLAVTSGWQEIHRGLIAAACEQDDPEDVLDEVSDVGMFLIDAIRLDLKGARVIFPASMKQKTILAREHGLSRCERSEPSRPRVQCPARQAARNGVVTGGK